MKIIFIIFIVAISLFLFWFNFLPNESKIRDNIFLKTNTNNNYGILIKNSSKNIKVYGNVFHRGKTSHSIETKTPITKQDIIRLFSLTNKSI